MASFIAELKRRNVFKVGVAYAIVTWLIAQIIAVLNAPLNLPDWVDTTIIIFLFAGFPIALLFAWAFELTPEGIKSTHDVEPTESIRQYTGQKLNYIVIAGLALALVFVVVDNYFLDETSMPEIAENIIDLGPQSEYDDSIDISSPIPGFSGRAAIAVLPFVNLSSDPDQEYFADGITEDLITGLQSFQSFPIIARTSTFQYKGTSPDVREIATALGAGYIIEGSVRKVEDDVRINVQLINNLGQHVWAENYNFKFEDVLRIQSELVTKVLHAIEPELMITEADRTRFVRTEEMEAFDYFLRATSNTSASFANTDLSGVVVSPERLELAREYALKALDIDPNFAAGWRILNHIEGNYLLAYAYLFTEQERQEINKRAIEYGERSRQLSPFEPAVCSCLAAMLVMNGDVEGARLLQEESLKYNPSSAISHAVMAKILQVSGEAELALEEITLAKRLSPKDMAMTFFLYIEAAIYQDLGRFDDAVASAKKSILLSSFNYDSEFVKITSLYASDQNELAVTAVSQLQAISPPDFEPVSGWGRNQPFPASVANNVKLASGVPLIGLSYNEGLKLVFEELGWEVK